MSPDPTRPDETKKTPANFSFLNNPGTVEDFRLVSGGRNIGQYREKGSDAYVDFDFKQTGSTAEICLDFFKAAQDNIGEGPVKLYLEVAPKWDADGDWVEGPKKNGYWITDAKATMFDQKAFVELGRHQDRFEQIVFDLTEMFFDLFTAEQAIRDAADDAARDGRDE